MASRQAYGGYGALDSGEPPRDPAAPRGWRTERSVRNCNLCSAACSFVALVTVCVMAGVQPEATANLWVDSIVVLNNTNVTAHVQAELWKQCDNSSKDYTLQVAEYRFNGSRAFMLPVPLRLGHVSVWPFLALVFVFSFLFQAFNARHARVSDDDGDDDDADADGAVRGAGGGGGDLDAAPGARGPDFSRWAEYALTSPFQVFVVATTFFVGERNLLLCLAFLQGALVLLGYGIELMLRDAIADIRVGDGARAAGRLWRALGLVAYAVAAHCVIWGILVAQFQDIVGNTQNCTEDSDMPHELIGALLGVQCGLFSLFGVVCIYQLAWLALRVYRGDFAQIREPRFARDFWLEATIVYCGLSCSAKSLLAILFVAVQYSMPREQR